LVHFEDLQASHLLKELFLVFLGGAIGSTSRWFAGEMVSNGVLVLLMVNVIGTAIAGSIGNAGEASKKRELFWITGFAGGFTTFSSLSYFLTELPLVDASILAALTLILSLALLATLGKKS
jgi:CrcB protein